MAILQDSCNKELSCNILKVILQDADIEKAGTSAEKEPPPKRILNVSRQKISIRIRLYLHYTEHINELYTDHLEPPELY